MARPLEHLRLYDLKRMSIRICRNCRYWETADCPNAPAPDDPDYKTHPWSSMTACDTWRAGGEADQALQEMTMRKLHENIDGQDDPKKRIWDKATRRWVKRA